MHTEQDPVKNPENIVTEIAAQAEQAVRPDLRKLQSTLHAYAKRARNPKVKAAEKRRKRAKLLRWRSRVRPLMPKDEGFKVIDTKTSKGKLYFELSNGQAVRADKVAPRVSKTANKQGLRTVTPAKITNPVLVRVIRAEIDANAKRAEAKAA